MARPPAVVLGVAGDFSAFNRGLSLAVANAQRTLNNARFSNPLGTISRDVRDFERSLQAASQRVITFSASLGTLALTASILKSIAKDTIAVEQAFVDINSVFQLSAQNLQKFSRDLFDVARQTSQSFEIAAEAAKEFSRQGLNSEETLKRVRDAMILTRASGLDITKSVETLTATINSFNSASVDSTRIINKLVAVDQSFAVSARDLAEALSRVGSTAQDAGVSFDQLIGLVTAAQQTTARGGSVIGNSFKTIFTRIGRADTLQQLEDLNIEVKDFQGNALDAVTVLKNLARGFDGLSESAKAQAAELVGGVFQINVLRSTLRDLGKEQGIFEQATKRSGEAFDEAIKRNEALNQSLASLLTQTQLTAKQVGAAIGEITFSDKLKEALQVINNNPFVDAFKNINTSDIGLKYGDDIGANIAEGILSGIGNILTGPALVYISKIFSGIAKTTFKIFGGDLAQLAGINQESNKQISLATKLNELYQAGNTALQGQLGTMRQMTSAMGARAGATPLSTPFTPTFGAAIYASTKFASTSPLAPRGLIPGIISQSRREDFDTAFVKSVQREISESGRNLSEAMSATFSEFSRLGITVADLERVMRNNVRSLDAYETQLRTQQEVAKRGRLLQTAFNSNRPLSKGGRLFSAVTQQAELAAEERFRGLIGKGPDDELSDRERQVLARFQRRAAYQAGESVTTQRERELAVQRSQRVRNGIFGATFALPFVSGFIPTGVGGTSSGQALGALSGGLQGAAIGGSISPTPLGLIGGSIAGITAGFISKLNKSFEELAAQIEEANARNAELINQATEFGRISEALRTAGKTGASDRDINTLIGRQRDVFAGITDPQTRRALLAAQGDATEEERVVSDLLRKGALEGSSRDVASAFKRLSDSRSIGNSFFGGNSEFSSLSTAIQVAIARRSTNNPGFASQVGAQFGSNPYQALRSIGVNQQEFPELFKLSAEQLRTLADAGKYAANNIKDLGDEASQAKLKQATFTRQIATIIQRLNYEGRLAQSEIATSGAINQTVGDAALNLGFGTPERIARDRGILQLQSVRSSGDAQFQGALGTGRGTILDSALRNNATNAQFLTAVLSANSQEQIAALENIAENSDLKRTIREVVFELQSIKDNTRQEIEKTSVLIEVSKTQAALEARARNLESGRFNEQTLNRLFEARLGARSPTGRVPGLSRVNSLIEQGDILDSLGVGKTENSQRIRETLSIISTTGMLAEIISEITGEVVKADPASIKDAARRGLGSLRGGTAEDAQRADIFNRVLQQLDRNAINPDAAIGRLGTFSKGASLGGAGPLNNAGISNLYGSAVASQYTFAQARAIQARESAQNTANSKIATLQQEYSLAPFTALQQVRSGLPGNEKQFDSNITGTLDNLLGRLIPDLNIPGDEGGFTAHPARRQIAKMFAGSLKTGTVNDFIKSATSSDGEIFNIARKAGADPQVFAQALQALILSVAQQFAGPLLEKMLTDIQQNIDKLKVPPPTSSTSGVPAGLARGTPTLSGIGKNLNLFDRPFTQYFGINPSPVPTAQDAPQSGIVDAIQKAQRQQRDASGRFRDAALTGDIVGELSAARELKLINSQIVYLSGLLTNNSAKRLFIDKQSRDVWDDIRQIYEDISKGALISGGTIESKFLEFGQKEGLSGDPISSLKAGFAGPFAGMKQDLFDLSTVGKSVADSLSNNFAAAFGDFATGTEKGKDAFRNFVVSVLQDSSRAFASKAVQGLLGMVLGPGGSLANAFGLPQGAATGGVMNKAPALLTAGEVVIPRESAMSIGYDTLSKMNRGIMGYANGGEVVTGGSGVVDDVFRMLRPGDFVMRKSAVQKYGSENLLEMSRNSRIQKRFFGGPMLMGALLGGGLGYATGGKKGALIGALGGALAGGLYHNYASSGSAFSTVTPPGTGASIYSGPFAKAASSGGMNSVLKMFAASAALGGIGALISPKPQDDSSVLPKLTYSQSTQLRESAEAQQAALLSNGSGFLVPVQTKDGFIVHERVRVAATRRFENGGVVPEISRYNSGGIVGGGISVARLNSGGVVPSPSIGTASINVRGYNEGGVVAVPTVVGSPIVSAGRSGGGGTIMGDININVTVQKDGTVSNQGMSEDGEGNQLARNLRAAVIEVVQDQMRWGGSLYKSYGASDMSK